MLSLEVMRHLGTAYQAAVAGDQAKAMDEMQQFERKFVSEGKFASPDEWLMILGAMGNVYLALEKWELAVLKFEDVCRHAEKHNPGSRETAGDYYSLSQACEGLGDITGALAAMEKSKVHLQKAGKWEEFRKGYEERISRLRGKKETEVSP
jgi:tetratricopeptide (TPR) repeat protein